VTESTWAGGDRPRWWRGRIWLRLECPAQRSLLVPLTAASTSRKSLKPLFRWRSSGTVGLRSAPLADSPAVLISKNEGLVLNTGPPAEAPKLILSQRALADFARSYKVQIGGSSLSLRKNSQALPCSWLVPDLIEAFRTAPPARPNSRAEVAGLYFELLMASGGGRFTYAAPFK